MYVVSEVEGLAYMVGMMEGIFGYWGGEGGRGRVM